MPTTDTDLYRAIIDGAVDGPLVLEGNPVQGVLYPRDEDASYFDRAGIERTSPPEVVVPPVHGGVAMVEQGGTVVFDVEGWFGHAGWRYFHVPDGTEYPEGLRIRRDVGQRSNRAGTLRGHLHEIGPRHRMTAEAFRGALDNLARNAVVRQVALSRSR